MLRPAIVAATLGAVVLSACGDDNPQLATTTSAPPTTEASTTTTSGSSTSTSGGPSTTAAGAVQTPAPPPAPLPAGCTPPNEDVKFTSGVATVEITSGPGKGRLDLAVQPRSRSEYDASARDLKGDWQDPTKTQRLYVNVSGGDPCRANPSAFVRIEAEGPRGRAFADVSRNRCKVELKAFTAQGVDGSFTCTQIGGGGEGVFIDANGTFSLRP